MPDVNHSFATADWLVLVAYFVAMVLVGGWFYRKNSSADEFTSGSRAMPGWLCGMSIFATYLSSISYLALPGKAFVDNWNAFAFSLALPVASVIAVRYFVPLYRNSGEVSAYSLLESRFGLWARVFGSCFYLLYQIARSGVVLYLMALPMAVLFGWDMRTVILATGVMVTAYAFVGGIVAVIWADAIQAIILLAGALLAVGLLLTGIPDGLSGVVETAQAEQKFSLGSYSPWLISEQTFWVVLLFGLFENIKNFGIDQSYVQRYIASSSDAEARRSVWLATWLYVPVSLLFLFIGTTLYVFYQEHPSELEGVRRVVAAQSLLQEGYQASEADYNQLLEARMLEIEDRQLGDRVFPHFIANHLPVGLRGLLIAAIFAAAMSTVSTSLNSAATLVMSDFFVRLMRPQAGDGAKLLVLRVATLLWGVFGTLVALALVSLTESALDIWWTLSGVLGAGLVGLFLVGLVSGSLSSKGAVWILGAGLCVIAWMTISKTDYWPDALSFLASPFHTLLVIVVGPLMMLLFARLATISKYSVESS